METLNVTRFWVLLVVLVTLVIIGKMGAFSLVLDALLHPVQQLVIISAHLLDQAVAQQEFQQISLAQKIPIQELHTEQNYKRFYQIYMGGMQNIATVTDSSDLETLASSCPLLNGEVVYNARAFHNSWYNGFKHYEDNCPVSSGGGGYRKASAVIPIQTVQKPALSIYPNPNNGKVYISGFDAKETNTKIEITDVTGKLVYKQQSNIGNGTVELNLQLISGVYFVHIIGSTGATQIQKIVINN
ncbi:MAG TPA: T9SS type A sorting domain-containing protein [Bacteroidia bacterium]